MPSSQMELAITLSTGLGGLLIAFAAATNVNQHRRCAAFAKATVAALGAAAVVRRIAATVAYTVEFHVERDTSHEALPHRYRRRAKR